MFDAHLVANEHDTKKSQPHEDTGDGDIRCVEQGDNNNRSKVIDNGKRGEKHFS